MCFNVVFHSLDCCVLCVLLIGFCVQQAPGMEELIWEQYTVTLQKVSACYIFGFQIFSTAVV